MFNAWEMSRNQHCILHQGCSTYANANIFYPNQDTMLYSETQLSAGFVTLPLHFINQNPIFAYNVLTIVSFFLAGLSMYLLMKYLSKGHEFISIIGGLVFEFAPIRLTSVSHLQNLSIFCLPLAVLLIIKYFDFRHRKYLVWLFLVLLYVFFASWVQMVFMAVALGILLLGLLIGKQVKLKPIAIVVAVIFCAALTTLPLAHQYIKFSKSNHATFAISEQEKYNSSLADYVIPNSNTLLGKLYYAARPAAKVNGYNLDSVSYHGAVLYGTATALIVLAYRKRKSNSASKQRYAYIGTFLVIGFIGFIISLGPFLKIKGSYIYPGLGGGLPVTIAMPYILVDKLLPQMSFLRSVGRASLLSLFALCCTLAYLPFFVGHKLKVKRIIYAVVSVLIIVELMPTGLVPMDHLAYSYNLSIPAVYKYIKSQPDINDIIILRGDDDYPGAPIPIMQAEDVLWSGYHNKNIFNGYSGYVPPTYVQDKVNLTNFSPKVLPRMKQLHLRYVLIDKQLSGPKSHHPNLLGNVRKTLPNVYEDKRYALFKII